MSMLPFISFKGRINYVSEFDACAMICDDIIKEVDNYDSDIVPIGFDVEWPFSFQTGSGKSALVQICLNNNICHLLHIYALKKLPAAFVILLSHPKVKLVGVNVKNDVWKLGRDFKEFPASKIVENNCLDCGKFANITLNRSCRWSLEKLTQYLLNKSINKDPKVRKSKWHIYPLNNEQKLYAATDAYVSWLLYITIQEKANLKEIEESMNSLVKVLWAGRLSYTSGLRLQKVLSSQHHQNLSNDTCNTLILIEHDPVFTVGIRDKGYSIEEEEKLKKLGAEFFRTNRGGLITFHGPGQLVAYPILNLKHFKCSVKWYVSQIEKMIIRLCAEYGIKAQTSPDTGVWVNDKKICAIGIHGSRYITTHGLALNCNTDLSWFDHIVPCGIEGKGVTSISKELNQNVTIQDVIPLFQNAFQDQFNCTLIQCSAEESSELLKTANSVCLK